MERKRTRLGAAVIRHFAQRHERRHRRDRHHVPVVRLDHGRQELFHHQEVRDGVYFEGLPDFRLGFFEDGPVVADAGVVDEDGGVTVFVADEFCDFGDVGGGCDVRPVEGDISGEGEFGLGNVEDDYADAGLREVFHDLFADSTAATGDEDEFAGGIPARAAGPVVQGPLGEGLVEAANEAEGEEDAEGFLGEWVA